MTLADRMKNYENVERKYLYSRLPIIVRLDSCHGHSNFAQWKKPWDAVMEKAMNATALYLCENIQGVKLAYVQSDEISLLIHNLDTFESQLPYNGNLQKIVSVSASMASLRFNQVLHEFIEDMQSTDLGASGKKVLSSWGIDEADVIDLPWNNEHIYDKEVYFDSRAFNIPIEEVNNYFLWRQQDATRNSIESWGQHFYSHKELIGITCNQLQNKMLTEKDFNWNNLPTERKRGRCIIKAKIIELTDPENKVTTSWIVDNKLPLFNENHEYIERHLQQKGE